MISYFLVWIPTITIKVSVHWIPHKVLYAITHLTFTIFWWGQHCANSQLSIKKMKHRETYGPPPNKWQSQNLGSSTPEPVLSTSTLRCLWKLNFLMYLPCTSSNQLFFSFSSSSFQTASSPDKWNTFRSQCVSNICKLWIFTKACPSH